DLEKKLAGREIEGLDKLLFHDEREPLFDAYGVNDGLEEAQSPVVPLRNGGRITIETTRALTAIDVDMGGSGGKQRSDDAVFAMNNAAAQAIPRQLRLRNIAGLIVVDFIGMRRKDHRQKLVERFKREFRLASVSVDVLGMTAAGLIEVTRRRDGLSLVELMLQPKSTEILLSVESLACQVLRDLMRTQGAGGYRLIASSRVVRVLSGPFKAAFDETVRRLGGALTMIEDPNESAYRVESEMGKL
ncbi:MAG: ribonuclease E/G, partial [Pseudomonadota bacterium]|nr:ribonuclease E/G [Pseudomonadota bacterium]